MVLTLPLTEQRNDAVAQKLVHRATVLVYGPQQDVEGAAHDLADLLRTKPLGQGSEAGHIYEQHTYLFVFAAGAQPSAASPTIVAACQAFQRALKAFWSTERDQIPTDHVHAAGRHAHPSSPLLEVTWRQGKCQS